MEAVLSWIRSIVILYVMGQVIVYLVMGKKYEKYIRFFLQLVMVLVIVRPVFVLLGDEETFKNRLSFYQISQSVQEQKSQLEQLQGESEEHYMRQCEQMLAEDVETYLEEHFPYKGEAEVTLSEDFAIERIEVSVEDTTDERAVRDALCTHYELEEDQVEVVNW